MYKIARVYKTMDGGSSIWGYRITPDEGIFLIFWGKQDGKLIIKKSRPRPPYNSSYNDMRNFRNNPMSEKCRNKRMNGYQYIEEIPNSLKESIEQQLVVYALKN